MNQLEDIMNLIQEDTKEGFKNFKKLCCLKKILKKTLLKLKISEKKK